MISQTGVLFWGLVIGNIVLSQENIFPKRRN